MDPGSVGVMIPIVAILAFAAIKMARIKAEMRIGGADPQAAERLAALEEEVGLLRRGLEEAHERLDFTERLLAQKKDERLNPPA
jgi:hypothetical protein